MNKLGNFHPDKNERGGGAMQGDGGTITPSSRGGFDDEVDSPESDALKGVHSSHGLKRALMRTARSGKLASDIEQHGAKPYKRQRFAQGEQRHGIHLGAGESTIDHGKLLPFGGGQ